MTYAAGKERGAEYVVGVANHNSVYGFTKKLRFQHVGLLQTRFVTHIRIKKIRPSLDYERVWGKETLTWRLSNPRNTYNADCNDPANLFGRSARFQALIGQADRAIIPRKLAILPGSFNPFKLWIGIDAEVDWATSPNILVPQRLKKIPLNLIYRDLMGARVLNPQAVKYWAMDFDSY